MIILNIVLAIFIVLEFFNLLVLYFKPSMRQANGLGAFDAWSKSKKDPEIHSLVKYLAYWVAGTKLIIISLLTVILVLAEPTLKIISVGVLVITIGSFYWKMFPVIKRMDKDGHIAPTGYHKTLSAIVAMCMLALALSAVLAYVGLV